MLSKRVVSTPVVSYDDMFMLFTQQFLHSFEELCECNFQEGACLDVKIKGRSDKQRINPLIRKATPEDIDEIIFIYKDIYDDSYPYKEMEDREVIMEMLNSPYVEWLIFETVDHEIVGCFTFILDFNKKLGNIRGFNLKKKYLGILDIMKMAMGSIIAMYKKYYDRIFRWYGECRTAHSKSQYFLSALGFKPIGVYPCKDIFYNEVESDLLILSYDKRTLTSMRSKKVPKILPEAFNGFLYSDKLYNLGSCKIKDPKNLRLDWQKIDRLQTNLKKEVVKDRFGYETITFSFRDSQSYFEFLYTPTVQNFEKTRYHVSCLEELYVFVQEFLECGKCYHIRYCEAFVSAYKPYHQKIFSSFGLTPRGYIPSWHYNQETDTFEDCLLFNWYNGKVSSNIQLLEEGQELVEMLGIQYADTVSPVSNVSVSHSSQPTIKSKKDLSNLVKPTIMTGLILYLLLLFGGLGTANLDGYCITTHAISGLGSFEVTELPLLFDVSSMIGGSTTMLFYYYLTKRLNHQLFNQHPFSNYLLQYTMLSGILGSLGIILVGVFSVDRACGLCHSISSVIAFGGFTISLLLFGLIIIHFETSIPKGWGIPGLLPTLAFISQCIFATPLIEWILLLSIIIALIPLFLWLVFR
jgi:hypothetical protein